MQYLNEPFFDDLRTKQQLGYVVFSRSVNHRDIIGCQFLVQSSHKACEYLVNSINNFIVDTREKIKAITDDEFEVQKQAVITKLAEKDINLQRENGRYWNEIATHEYLFNR
jgi:secreted Zn-dependent insulinase-like peptidase